MIKGFTSEQKLGEQKYQTLQPIGAGRQAMDMLPKAVHELSAIPLVPGKDSTPSKIDYIGHSARIGDVIRFVGGPLASVEVAVIRVDASTIYLGHKLPSTPAGADTFKIMRHITLTISADGELVTSSGPVRFVKDGVSTQVVEDTGDPTNNTPLPVKLTDVTGDVNITAGDLNVQLSHTGANPDSTRVGDGTNELGITAANEAKVKDTDVLASLVTLNAKDYATETSLAAVLAKIIAAPATEAKQDTSIAALVTLNAKDYATETSLAAVLAKIIAAPATEAKQDAIVTELELIKAAGIREVFTSVFLASQALVLATTTAIGANIPAGTTVKELEIAYTAGDTLGVYYDGVLVGMVTQGGGKIPVNLVGDGSLPIRLKAESGDVTVNGLMINYIK